MIVGGTCRKRETIACFCFHSLLVLSFILITGWAADIDGASLETDTQVLLQLKAFLEGNNHINHGQYMQWLNSDPSPCHWPGITCDADEERVTGINLKSSNISCELFANFSQLTALTDLDLSLNTISGPIPAELNQCTSLKYLNLSHNLINGELNLTGLINLEVLDLTLNRFSGGIRDNFPALCQNLVVFNISMNNFTSDIIGCFDECLKLEYLDLSSNHFEGQVWKGFSSLREFSVSENNFTEEITEDYFPSDCSLEVLDFSSNKFSGEFPNSIANCSRLTSLNLWGNGFTGMVPSSIGSLSELQGLFLGSNNFDRSIPETLLNCTKLVFLDLSKNNFGGEIQPIFRQFMSVKYLVLHGNLYTGGIESSGILKLPNVARLDLSHNYFTGPLPVDIAKMPNLKFLILAYNKFSGVIPAEYGNMSTLQALDLSFNQLTGSIPPAIGMLTSLLWLMLGNNHLSGAIPPEIGNCSSLLWLNLASNKFNGSIPPEISLMGRNPDPTFEVNRLDDGIPAGSGECLSMKRWIPATYPPFSFAYTLMNMKSCRWMWDRLLKGFGIFPMCLNSSYPMRTLTISGYIQLTDNRLSGSVPEEIGDMKNLSLLQLSYNQLSSRLPSSIGQLPLVMLNMSHNNFSGEIPPELSDIKCLRRLDLSYNNFSGELQASLNKLNELDTLNLSYNPFLSGIVPETGQMATFDNTSFIGDPLIIFPSLFRKNSTSGSIAPGGRKLSRRMVAFWVFFALTVAFFACGVVSMVFCLGIRTLVGPEPDPHGVLLDGVKRRSDAAPSTSSSSSPSSSQGVVKVFRPKKTAFTYADVVAATGGFATDAVIGRGGFGVVYKGALADGRRVAVKRLRREDAEGEREFLAEMDALAARGPHPQLVPLLGWCLSGSEKLLVYEYMPGGSLDDVITDWRRLGWQKRIDVALGVARALVYLHHECVPAVVHRDVKASNVLLDGAGSARMTDFGLARSVVTGNSGVSTVVAGTVGYIAPEYGHTGRATTRGDVYSYGVLAMELATGRRAVEDGKEECLVDWARRMAGEGWRGLRGAVVPVMVAAAGRREGVEDGVVEGLAAMCALLRVGMQCTAEAPHARPDMRKVLDMLLKISGGGGGDSGDVQCSLPSL